MRNKIKTQTRKIDMDFRTYGDINKISSYDLLKNTLSDSDSDQSTSDLKKYS